LKLARAKSDWSPLWSGRRRPRKAEAFSRPGPEEARQVRAPSEPHTPRLQENYAYERQNPLSKSKRHQVFAWWAGSSETVHRRLQWPLSREALDMRHCLPARWAGGSVFAATLCERWLQQTNTTGHMKLCAENRSCFRTGFTRQTAMHEVLTPRRQDFAVFSENYTA
jgi:hypothetical protein